MQIFNTLYGWVVAAAGVFATLWGLAKAIGALRRWVAKAWAKHKERREMLPNLVRLNEQMASRMDSMQQQIRMMGNELGILQQNLQMNNDCTATVMLQKMMWAYHTYYLQGTPIPLDVRTALQVMFNLYKASGVKRNHIPQDFVEAMYKCKLAGQKQEMSA